MNATQQTLFSQLSKLFLPTLVQLEHMVQQVWVLATRVTIMTDKLHCPAVFNNGLCRILVNTE